MTHPNFVEVTIPYDTALSKNKKGITRTGRVYTPTATKAAREALSWSLKSRMKGKKFKEEKLEVKLEIFRPDMRTDPANFLDYVLDGIKEPIGIDDRWYEIVIRWEINKENPRIRITITQ